MHFAHAPHRAHYPDGERGERMRLLRIALALCIAAGFLVGAPAQAATTRIVLKVQTTQGVPIPSASYGFLPGCDEACGPYQTDAAGLGEFYLSNGDYTVFAGARGYAAASVDFRVGPGAPTEVVITLSVGGTIRVTGLPVPSPGKMAMGRVTPYPVAPVNTFFERIRLAGLQSTALDPGTAEITGLAPGEYRVLFFLQGMEGMDSFRRAWYGGGLLMSSGKPVRVELGQTTSIVAGDLPISRSLPALPPPEVTGDSEGFTVTVHDPEGLGVGVGYEFQFRNATAGEPWRPWWIYADRPQRLVRGEQIVGAPGDRFEFRARAFGSGEWSEIASAGPDRTSAASAVSDGYYQVTGDWSPPRSAMLLPEKPTRPPKPAVWMKGKKRLLGWGPVFGATRYEVQRKRGKGKWVTLKPRWTNKTQRVLPKLSKGAWRFQVRSNNLGGSSPWSKASKPMRVA